MTTESWLESKSTSPTITRETTTWKFFENFLSFFFKVPTSLTNTRDITLLSNISCKGPSNWSLEKYADLNENTSIEVLILCDTLELRPVKIDLREIQIPLPLHGILLPENFLSFFFRETIKFYKYRHPSHNTQAGVYVLRAVKVD